MSSRQLNEEGRAGRRSVALIVTRSAEAVRSVFRSGGQGHEEAIVPSDPIQNVQEPARLYTLPEALDEGVFSGFMSISIFRQSPIGKAELEAITLRTIMQDAHARAVPIADAYITVPGLSGRQEWIETVANRLDMQVDRITPHFRFDPKHPERVYLSADMSDWMTERAAQFGWTTKVAELSAMKRKSPGSSLEPS